MAGFDDGQDRCDARAGSFAAKVQPVFKTDGDGFDRTFRRVVVDLDYAVIDVALEPGPFCRSGSSQARPAKLSGSTCGV